MGQDLNAYGKATRECDISIKRRKEEAEMDMLGELYYCASEIDGNRNSAAEMKAESRLDEALESQKAADEIMDLAADWYNEGKETGFRMGFHMATKLLVEGLNGGVR